jgi:1,4-dihydroxy-2-naphthoyl-CoA hydrolase
MQFDQLNGASEVSNYAVIGFLSAASQQSDVARLVAFRRADLGPAAYQSRRQTMDLLTRLKDQPLPFASLLGIDLVSAEPEKFVAEMTVRPEFCTRPAVLHGGAIMAFADTLGALATVANLSDEAGTTTIESKTNFIGAAPAGARIVGETTPVHRGRRTMVWQTRVTTTDGKLVAMVVQTQLIL